MFASPEAAWAELETRAQRLLEHAKEVEPRALVRRYGSVLRLWHFPAFGPQRTWTILRPGRKAEPGAPPLVREITWDRDADHQRSAQWMENPAPTIRLREAALPATELDALLALGGNLAVPVLGVSNTVGVDGEYFGLETYEVSPNLRVQWWCAGPTQWRHWIDWVAELRAFLTHCLAQAG